MAARTETERITSLEASNEHVATKADIADVRVEIANLRTEVKTDIESLRSEIKTMKWWIGIAIPLTALAVQLLDRAIV